MNVQQLAAAMKSGDYVNNYDEVPVGAGYWALRRTIAASGKAYTKLVKRDRSPSGTVMALSMSKRVPSVGHNARRQRILDKRANKLMVKGA